MGKKSRSGSGMNIPDHISESLETIFWIKIFKFFYADPGSGFFLTLDPGWKNSVPGYGINIPDPQDWIPTRILQFASPGWFDFLFLFQSFSFLWRTVRIETCVFMWVRGVVYHLPVRGSGSRLLLVSCTTSR
jgi:hypothetical protein